MVHLVALLQIALATHHRIHFDFDSGQRRTMDELLRLHSSRLAVVLEAKINIL